MSNLLSLVLLVLGVALVACGGNNTASSDQSANSHQEMGPEYASAYVCPMHCEGSGSDEAGNCPVCGMAYVALEDHISDGHEHGHSHDHDGHDHEGHNH